MQFGIERGLQLLHLPQILQSLSCLICREKELGPLQICIDELLIQVDAYVEVIESLLLVIERSRSKGIYSWASAR